jgi:hypothetical protein
MCVQATYVLTTLLNFKLDDMLCYWFIAYWTEDYKKKGNLRKEMFI